MAVERVTYRLGDADLILETGKIGKQANGCVYAQWGGAAVIATIFLFLFAISTNFSPKIFE